MEFLSVNPVLLFAIFGCGYVFGLLTKNLSGWKILTIGFLGVFIYRPLTDAGLAATFVFLVGAFSHHFGSIGELFDFLRDIVADRRSSFSSDQTNQNATQSKSRFNNADEAFDDLKDFFKQEKKAKSSGSNKKRSDSARQQRTEGFEQQQKSDAKSEAEKLRKENERLRREASAARRQAEDASSDKRSPMEILGLQEGFTKDELKKAYRTKVQQWHSDQLSGRAPELVKLAEEEMKKINAAFDLLKKSFS